MSSGRLFRSECFSAIITNQHVRKCVYIGVTIQKLHQLSDDRITSETLSYNNPCPSSPSLTIYIYIHIYTQTYANLHRFQHTKMVFLFST